MNMIKEIIFVEDKEKVPRKYPLRMMEQPELSLGPSISSFAVETDANLCRKRKHTCVEPMGTQAGIELQLNDPLPMDWEQCLDLQSGRMYYLNRKTLKKSWVRPKEEQKLDLELNMSTLPTSQSKGTSSTTTNTNEQYPRKYTNSSGSMIAVACLNCHLLVMLSKSSPSCPNCKYVHSLQQQPRKIEPAKTLETLSLLH